MTEMRIRPRYLLIIVVIFGLVVLLLYTSKTSPLCDGPAFLKRMHEKYWRSAMPTIYAITPTYNRPIQKAELTRLSHIFMLIPNLFWIIIEDANTTTTLTTNVRRQAGLLERSTQMSVKTPLLYKLKKTDPNWKKPRGVEQRNLGLSWLRVNMNADKHSIVYFMDDDNAYSLELFEEMAKIQPGRVGVWPVGLVGGLMVERPLLNADGSEVVGFNSVWRPERPFPIDMAGFAIAGDLLFKHPKAIFSYEIQRGYQESEILRHLTTVKQLQPMANKCRNVLVWHTRSQKTDLAVEMSLNKKGVHSDSGLEVK